MADKPIASPVNTPPRTDPQTAAFDAPPLPPLTDGVDRSRDQSRLKDGLDHDGLRDEEEDTAVKAAGSGAAAALAFCRATIFSYRPPAL